MAPQSAPSSIQELARLAASHFTTKTRDEGDSFFTLKDDAPEWMREFIREAHGVEMLPDDWRYAKVYEALEFIASADDPDDGVSEFADDAVDVYTAARFAWLASNLNRAGYCDEAAAEFGAEDTATDIVATVGMGQYMEAGEIYAQTLAALDKHLKADEINAWLEGV